MDLQEDIQKWHAHLDNLKPVLARVAPDPAWAGTTEVSQTLGRIRESLSADLNALHAEAQFIFSVQGEAQSLTQRSADLLRKWHVAGAPSLTALCIFAIQGLNLKLPEDFVQATLVSSILGEVENDLTYHNNMHYRKVLFNAMRLVSMHNFIYDATTRAFNERQIALILMAACAHDLGHDGKGNTIKGVFHQGRLEKLSYDLTLPYFHAAGFADEAALAEYRVMVLCTEVTPLDDPGNPMNQMKAAYRFHYLGDKTKTHTLNLDEDIAALEVDEKLTMVCLILHEADIACSSGINYDVTKYETSIYMHEIGTKHARPQHVIDFLDQICQRQFLSDAGQRLYAGNLARIYALAQADIEAGDELYPPPEHAEFVLAFSGHENSKTIN